MACRWRDPIHRPSQGDTGGASSKEGDMSNPTDEHRRIVLVGAWLARFDDLFPTFGKSLSDRPHVFDDFIASLGDMSPDDLEGCFNEWRRTGKRFPVPADIRGILTAKEQQMDQYLAEKAWDHVRWMIQFFVYDPEGGFKPLCISKDNHISERVSAGSIKEDFRGGYLLKPKPFDARTMYAIEQAGGLKRIYALPPGNEFDFCRKAFLQAHRYFAETSGLQFPGREEPKQVMDGLRRS